MQNNKEQLLNLVYFQLTENYFLKGVCLEILKDLDKKKELNKQEENWQQELYNVLLAAGEI